MVPGHMKTSALYFLHKYLNLCRSLSNVMHCPQDVPQVERYGTVHMNKESVWILASLTDTQNKTEMYCVGVCWWHHTMFVLRHARKTVKTDYYLFFISVLSIVPSKRNSLAPTERIFLKYYISVFFENPSRKFKFHFNLICVWPYIISVGKVI